MMHLFRFAIATAVMILFVPVAAQAQSAPKLIATYKAWEAYSYIDQGKPVCFMLGRPQSTTATRNGKKVKVQRGDTYTLVTHRPARNSRDVVSITVGYPFAEGSTVPVRIDKKRFALYTADKRALKSGADAETAWARDEDDAKLVKAMAAGNRMVVTGQSRRGTKTRDTYSLAGFTAAHKAIDKACK